MPFSHIFIGHETQIEREVVDAGYLHRQQLLGLEEVVEVKNDVCLTAIVD